MAAQIDDRAEGSAAGSPTHAPHALAQALRDSASAIARCAGGGVALIFGAPGAGADRDAPLRAAAGFPNPQAAIEAAELLSSAVRRCIGERALQKLASESLGGDRTAGGVTVHPLEFGGRLHGALLVGWPQPPEASSLREIAEAANVLGLRFDHAHQIAERTALQAKVERLGAGQDQSDEVLKLSEALFAQDIELLRSNEKLGKIERLKNDFIEKMSRELRTPLNHIIEAIISVLTGENDALSEGAKSSLRAALDDGTAFLRTLQNILDLWRIKQAELPVEIQDVNFRETIDEAIFSVQDSLGNKQLVIEPLIEQPFPKVRTDLTKVSQIVFLLLDNAVKFTPRGRVEIAARVESGRLICEVRDTGIGICPDDQQFVFDEFFQLDEPSSRRYCGAGLGLTLVRDLVALLDGEISLHSEVGAGSTFRFSIPVQVMG